MSIKCGHCGHRHVDVEEVRACASGQVVTMPEAVERVCTVLGGVDWDHEHELAIEQEFDASRGSEETDGEPFPGNWVRCPVPGCAGAHASVVAVREHEREANPGSPYRVAYLHNVSCNCGTYDRCNAYRRTNAAGATTNNEAIRRMHRAYDD